jgi:hypothetical protein
MNPQRERFRVKSGLASLVMALMVAGAARADHAAETPGRTYLPAQGDTSGGGRPRSLREAYPDYKPGADDPELDAVKRGRRLVHTHSIALEPGGSKSIQDLIEQTVAATTLADGEALKRCAVTRNDFVRILWPEFPQSRPITQITPEEAWSFVENKNLVSFNRTAGEFNLTPIQLVSYQVGTVRKYTNFKIHTDIRVTVRKPGGEPYGFHLIRSIVERNGRFKIYSTWD